MRAWSSQWHNDVSRSTALTSGESREQQLGEVSTDAVADSQGVQWLAGPRNAFQLAARLATAGLARFLAQANKLVETIEEGETP